MPYYFNGRRFMTLALVFLSSCGGGSPGSNKPGLPRPSNETLLTCIAKIKHPANTQELSQAELNKIVVGHSIRINPYTQISRVYANVYDNGEFVHFFDNASEISAYSVKNSCLCPGIGSCIRFFRSTKSESIIAAINDSVAPVELAPIN